MLTKNHSLLIKPTNSIFNLQKSNSTTMLQRNFNNPKPVRPYNRFLKERIANSGLDPNEGFKEFIKGDLIQPLYRDSIYKRNFAPIYRENWALDTTKTCPREPLLPKIQQYKNYYFQKSRPNDAQRYQNTFLSSDNIAIRIPQIHQVEQKNSFLLKKSNYGSHIETIKGWGPQASDQTNTNRSSVRYNILTNDLNKNEKRTNCLERNINCRKKGIAEFKDLSNAYHSNFNPEYQHIYDKDNHIFHNYKGIFSHMYDLAHRNGNIIVPFRKGSLTNQIPDNRLKISQ